jgi:hypothetical protein
MVYINCIHATYELFLNCMCDFKKFLTLQMDYLSKVVQISEMCSSVEQVHI